MAAILGALSEFVFVWLYFLTLIYFLLRLVRKRASNLHVQLLDKVTVLEHFGCGKLTSLCDLVDLIIPKTDDNVLRLEICVNNFALAVHIVQTNQTLSR